MQEVADIKCQYSVEKNPRGAKERREAMIMIMKERTAAAAMRMSGR